eukprot:CAMPEP_0196808078 /NCGR_PEP_ID=MMETSP1362-20130617/8054_1 /TAXON_ID=163516 /ORGANISM="Leptocylindrus danicus, Strain CCMP1856" /LENGTH=523 /DNA_ID=CAMNT_0042182259 /DNA_START=94 /DNA_END=1665 /DNA_ORIENTATION=+
MVMKWSNKKLWSRSIAYWLLVSTLYSCHGASRAAFSFNYKNKEIKHNIVPSRQPLVHARTVVCKSSKRNVDSYSDYIEWDYDDDEEEALKPRSRRRNKKRKQKPFTWERYDGVDICLPKIINGNSDNGEPKAIIHFIGGTGLGVFPRQTYAPFLEGLASNNFAVVATPLPVFLSPFDHRAMCAEIAEMFQTVYHDVIEDEYGPSAARAMPIVGIGHSLGSRLHVIMNTATSMSSDDDYNEETTTGNLMDVAYPREANVLLSFNNYSTSRSVPLLDEMNLIAKGMQRGLEVSKPLQNQIGSKLNQGYQTLRKELEDDSDFDADAEFLLKGLDFLETLPNKVTKMFQEDNRRWNRSRRQSGRRGTRSSRRGRSGGSSSTEFHPSPDELWNAIQDKQYVVEKNLFVQFSADKLDQSAKLATAIKSAMGSGSGSEKDALQNLKYAVLPGGHLTPVVRRQTGGMFLDEDIFQDAQPGAMDGDDDEQVDAAMDSKLLDLVRTVVTYVNAKVCDLSQDEEVVKDSRSAAV